VCVHGKNKKNALIKLLLWSYPLNQVQISNSLSNKGSDNQLFSSLTERIIPDKASVGNGVFPHHYWNMSKAESYFSNITVSLSAIQGQMEESKNQKACLSELKEKHNLS